MDVQDGRLKKSSFHSHDFQSVMKLVVFFALLKLGYQDGNSPRGAALDELMLTLNHISHVQSLSSCYTSTLMHDVRLLKLDRVSCVGNLCKYIFSAYSSG